MTALLAESLNFPTSVAVDADGTICIAESGLPFAGAPPGGRIWRLNADGGRTLLLDGLRAPVNGLTAWRGSLFLSEGGHPGRISRLDPDGRRVTILDALPGPGNYHTNMVAFGPDDRLYFSQGAMTNSGIVGLDAYELGWLGRLPHAHDLPGMDIHLAGLNVQTRNPLDPEGAGRVLTGGFVPFGTATAPGQCVRAHLPCTASVMRCAPDGSDLELFAWGLRNAYGLGFLPDGRLLATDQGADERGSRPIGNAPDLLFEVRKGAWYGWPDFVDGEPITDRRYRPESGPSPEFLLANHAELPPPERAMLRFPPHVAAVKFDVLPASARRWSGHLFVALFGDESPMTGPPGPRMSRALARIDPRDWSLHACARPSGMTLHRPIDVCADLSGEALLVLDFGAFEMTGTGVSAVAGSGALWRLDLGSL